MNTRINLYTSIHKAIRFILGSLNTRTGRTDFADEAELAALRAHADEVFELLAKHAMHEDTFIHPALAAVRPDVHAMVADAHEEQESRLAELRAELDAIEPRSEHAPTRGHRWLLAVARLTGELLTHMSDEEELVMPALWSAYDDAALEALHARILESIPPEEMLQTMGFMMSGMSHPERVATLEGIRANAPPPVFDVVLSIAERALDAATFARLSDALVPRSRRAA